jgi:hypothetical protein
MTGVAMRESSYMQFVYPGGPGNEPDLFDLEADYQIDALWPNESSGGGQYIGLMQILTSTNQQSDPNAWKWAAPDPVAGANANDAVNLFSGNVAPNKMIIASGYESDIINGVPSNHIPGHWNLGSLTGLQLENMALVLYAGDIPGNGTLGAILTQQYYIPQCQGVQQLNNQGYLTCSTGWQWVINAANQSAGVNYVSNSNNNGVRNLLQ